MTNVYKTAFEGLGDLIRNGNDASMIQLVADLEKDLKTLDKADDARQANSHLLTETEWNKLGYKERLALKNEQPETYEAANNGNYKEMI